MIEADLKKIMKLLFTWMGFVAGVLCFLLFSFLPLPSLAREAKSVIEPEWMDQKIQVNSSYLSQLQWGDHENLNTEVFLDEKSNREIRTQAEDEYIRYEERKNSGLSEMTDDTDYYVKMKKLAHSAMDGLGKIHSKISLKNLRRYSESSLADIRAPLAGAVLAAALYRGKAFGFNLSDDVRLENHTALKDKESSLTMFLPWVSSSVTYNEKDHFTARLSKSIVDNVSAEVNTTDKGTLQLNYGLSF